MTITVTFLGRSTYARVLVGERTPRVRFGGRSAHDATARTAKEPVTITCHAASPDAACDAAAPVMLKKMPA